MPDETESDLYLAWFEHDLRVRDTHTKAALEYVKIASEASKLIVTNLFVINAGALAALPTLSGFVAKSASDDTRLRLTITAAGIFVGGLILAGLCAWLIYFNFVNHSGRTHMEGGIESTSKLRASLKVLPNRLTVEEDKNLEQREKQNKEDYDYYDRWVRWTFGLAHLAGIASLGCFIVGCLWLAFHPGLDLRDTTPNL